MSVSEISSNNTVNRLQSPLLSDSPERIQEVFSNARTASAKIAALSVKERLKFVDKIKHIVMQDREMILDRVVAETGKSRMDAIASEIFGLLDVIEFLEGTAVKALADEKIHTPLVMMGKKSKVYYEPRGVILVISPWNYPFYQGMVPFLFSFVAGNATVLKPSEHTPLQGLMEDIINRAGVPADSFQCLYGDGSVGAQAIEQNPDYISFTGSVRTGKKIMGLAAEKLIPLELELGGKDPAVVFEDVNLERTVAGTLWGSFTTAGQSCTSVEKILVQKSIYDSFLEKFVGEAKTLTLSDADPLDHDMGGMTVSFQTAKVHEQVEDARQKGATIHCGGVPSADGMSYPPTVLTNVTADMEIYNEESFGPIVVIEAFESEAEALKLANNTVYGLSASVWSKDIKRAERVARGIQTGNVSINNVMLTEGNAALPFGGTKESGIGRIKGIAGLRGLCNSKSVIIDAQSKKIEANWFPYTPKKYNLFASFLGVFLGGLSSFINLARYGLPLEGHAQKKRK